MRQSKKAEGCTSDDCSPTVRDIIVTNNRAGEGGGGIRYTGGSVNLENVGGVP